MVMKFGGTSVMTPDRIKNVAQIIAREASAGKEILVVVSAMGHATEELIKLSAEVTSMPDRRELDALMATGEQVSATLVTMALQAIGRKARSFNGPQAGISTDSQFGNARIEKIDASALSACLESGCIPVVTGFQGMTAAGETITLGRGGSDTTAIALAAALHAERCDIYTDVDGIYSADPRIIKNAVKLDEVSVSEMLELAENGVQVLNARSVQVARDNHVTVRVRSTFNPGDQGTLVSVGSHKSREFTGVTVNNALSCIEIDLDKLELGPDRNLRNLRLCRHETRRNLLKLLSDMGIRAEIVHPCRPNPFRILLTVKTIDTVTALALLHKSALSIRNIRVIKDLSAVVLVATEVGARHEADAIAAMSKHKIPVMAVAWHHQRLTLLVPASMGIEAAHALHLQFAHLKLVA